jgi:hypothetical protein
MTCGLPTKRRAWHNEVGTGGGVIPGIAFAVAPAPAKRYRGGRRLVERFHGDIAETSWSAQKDESGHAGLLPGARSPERYATFGGVVFGLEGSARGGTQSPPQATDGYTTMRLPEACGKDARRARVNIAALGRHDRWATLLEHLAQGAADGPGRSRNDLHWRSGCPRLRDTIRAATIDVSSRNRSARRQAGGPVTEDVKLTPGTQPPEPT